MRRSWSSTGGPATGSGVALREPDPVGAEVLEGLVVICACEPFRRPSLRDPPVHAERVPDLDPVGAADRRAALRVFPRPDVCGELTAQHQGAVGAFDDRIPDPPVGVERPVRRVERRGLVVVDVPRDAVHLVPPHDPSVVDDALPGSFPPVRSLLPAYPVHPCDVHPICPVFGEAAVVAFTSYSPRGRLAEARPHSDLPTRSGRYRPCRSVRCRPVVEGLGSEAT
ncbi:exported hypothetical protein [Rhodococcus ruber]|uniref:Uncharacterized protein n=1 Tax=Rhodococcus ruber TaxID=1830 RepID=A0A098BLG9_9NOCA|nr:exported hypothetical protein [Rhodococcus ruber]